MALAGAVAFAAVFTFARTMCFAGIAMFRMAFAAALTLAAGFALAGIGVVAGNRANASVGG